MVYGSRLMIEAMRNCLFASSDINEAINELKSNKSPSFDGIYYEVLKMGISDRMSDLLAIYFNMIVAIGYIPDGFNSSILVPIPKK
jgi:hypothetical protein